MKPQTKGKILIIDDDYDITNIYQEVLTQGGFEVVLARDGQEGLTKITGGDFKLVLLDIMMPKLDGISILKTVKEKNLNPKNIPIVVLSALNQEYIVKTALLEGAVGYIIKPDITPDQIITKITPFLK